MAGRNWPIDKYISKGLMQMEIKYWSEMLRVPVIK